MRMFRMEGLRGGRSARMAAVAMWVLAAVVVPEVSAIRWMVGGNYGWDSNVNFTVWAQDKHFYNGDWLFFVYDRNQKSVLEVNETDYQTCNSNSPLHNWTRGVGRDVVPLNVTRPYYFISGNGFCFGGMKLAIQVENPPPPPMVSPVKASSPLTLPHTSHLILPAVLAIGGLWEALLLQF